VGWAKLPGSDLSAKPPSPNGKPLRIRLHEIQLEDSARPYPKQRDSAVGSSDAAANINSVAY
jgi:hypothetical protein